MTKESQINTFGQKAKKYLKEMPKRYFITAFSGMAQGLFVTLIAGTILATIATEIIQTTNYIGQFGYYLNGATIDVTVCSASDMDGEKDDDIYYPIYTISFGW